MRIFTLPPAAGSNTEPNFYDSLQKVRLRQQLEMYSLGEHCCPVNTNKTQNVQLCEVIVWRIFYTVQVQSQV